ncbi:MAG: 50S ribosomal protein L18 [Patescibacteria group bacterium]
MVNAVKRKIRHTRIRKVVSGSSEKPRVAVFKSLNYLYAQAIDDVAQKTLASITTKTIKLKGTKTEKASEAGRKFGENLVKLGIKSIAFDRGGHKYTGRVQSFADGVRSAGISF